MRLVIVPDGLLSSIPFEALPKSELVGTEYKSWPLLVKDHAMSYAYSASLWYQEKFSQRRRKAPKGFLGMFPRVEQDFTPERVPRQLYSFLRDKSFKSFPKLIEEEPMDTIPDQAHILQKFEEWGGDWYEGIEALLGRFLSVAEQYQIIHLVSHGFPRDSLRNDGAYLVFQPISDSVDNEHLHPSQVFELELLADLVVLNACQTNISSERNIRSEGMLSLGYGFSYAGARSIVSTLHKVPSGKLKHSW